jgi:hypothetical protein
LIEPLGRFPRDAEVSRLQKDQPVHDDIPVHAADDVCRMPGLRERRSTADFECLRTRSIDSIWTSDRGTRGDFDEKRPWRFGDAVEIEHFEISDPAGVRRFEREIELFLEKRKQFAERQLVVSDPLGDIGKTIVSGDVRAGVSKARLNDAARRLDRDRRAALVSEKI